MREVKAARVNTSLTEQLKGEQTRRQTIERSFVEMESVLKKRILYLEQYKAAVGNKMGHLQGRLDLSVPQEDYLVRTCVCSYGVYVHPSNLQQYISYTVRCISEQSTLMWEDATLHCIRRQCSVQYCVTPHYITLRSIALSHLNPPHSYPTPSHPILLHVFKTHHLSFPFPSLLPHTGRAERVGEPA